MKIKTVKGQKEEVDDDREHYLGLALIGACLESGESRCQQPTLCFTQPAEPESGRKTRLVHLITSREMADEFIAALIDMRDTIWGKAGA